jgi:ABC-2 type transport system permease protein
MRAFAVGWKDLRVTLRDRSALGILLAMPMVLILILGSALSGGGGSVSHVHVAVVNQDAGKLGKRVTDALFTNEQLTSIFDTRSMRDPAEARALVQRGDLVGALVVPSDFTKSVNAGRPVELTVYTDPGHEISAGVFRSVAEALSAQVSAASVAVRTTVHYMPVRALIDGGAGDAIQRAVRSATSTESLNAVTVDERDASRGRQIGNLDYYAAGMSVMFLLFGSMFGAFSLVRERNNWTLPRMLTSPAGKFEILGGKMLGVFVVGAVQWTALFAFTIALGVKWGDPLAVWLVALSTVAAATGLAVLLSTVGKTVRSVQGVGPLVIQLMAVFGGSMIPVSQFPDWLRPMHWATVNGWAIDGMLCAMRGEGMPAVWPSVVALLGLAAAFFALGVWRLRWE